MSAVWYYLGMNIENAVRQEVDWQIAWHESHPGQTLNLGWHLVDEKTKNMFPRAEQLRNVDDEDQFCVPEMPDVPHALYARSAGDLGRLFQAITKRCVPTTKWSEPLPKIVKHEDQHAQIGPILGRRGAPKFMVLLAVTGRTPQGIRCSFVPETVLDNLTVSKLGIALFLANPRDVAKGVADSDMDNLKTMGYNGPKDVARHIKEHNRRYRDNQLPLPLSARW